MVWVPGKWARKAVKCQARGGSDPPYAIDVYTPLAYLFAMSPHLHVVAELPQFLRDVAAFGMSEVQHQTIIDAIAANPQQGDEIRGSGGVRKVRFAGRGKGKSGGYRAVTAYFGPDAPVYLLALLSKGERGNFSASEITAFKKLTGEISRHWRRRKI
jgi:hypothetical protein